MRVRDEDPGARRAHPGELEPQRRRVAAGVDHDRLGGAALGPDDVAVRPERAELVGVDDEGHPAIECNEGACALPPPARATSTTAVCARAAGAGRRSASGSSGT